MRRIPVFWISSAFLLGIPLAAVIPIQIRVWKISFFVCLGLVITSYSIHYTKLYDALDLCYVAAGRLDGFWELSINAWDIAAGVP